jgi:hypothetical protein
MKVHGTVIRYCPIASWVVGCEELMMDVVADPKRNVLGLIFFHPAMQG